MSDSARPRQIEAAAEGFGRLVEAWHRGIVGQDDVLRKVLVALLAGGHVLIEGVPGLAKTMIVTTLAGLIGARFKRIQFTPDLLPGDLVGSEIFNPVTGSFSVRRGPVFTNLLLADEINRAPAKVQSALLEAMQERRVTIGGEDLLLPDPFFVLATQNPIEHEGTFPLPEAQVDRFMFKVLIRYPSREEEARVIELMARTSQEAAPASVLTTGDLIAARRLVNDVRIDPAVSGYILSLVRATREPVLGDLELRPLIDWGASPRAGICLAVAARANALLDGRDYVLPDDVRFLAADVLRHRLILSFEAEAENVSSDDLIERILQRVPAP